MLNGMKDGHKYDGKIGCIEIGNNGFIEADVKILYDVKIGDNVIIAAGTLVNKDVPSNSVWGGVPGHLIGSFDDYLSKRRKFSVEHPANNTKQEILLECETEMWERFNKDHLE